MNYPQFRYLFLVDAIYEHRRIIAAAQAVHLSQPAATQALARVEDALGTTLFTRHPKGMIPTEPGMRFYPRLKAILGHLEQGDLLFRKRIVKEHTEDLGRPFIHRCSSAQLRAFVAVAKSGSFSDAASELNLSQPAVTRAVNELKTLCDAPLFEQTRGGVVLTLAAEILFHRIQLAYAEMRQAQFEINEHLGRDVTRISLGTLPLASTALMPDAIDQLFREFPSGVQVNCVDARYDSLIRELRFGEIDLIIGATRTPFTAQDLKQETLSDDRIVVVAAPDHPLLKQAQIDIKDTLKYPWIAPPKDTPVGSYLYDILKIQRQPETPVRVVARSLALVKGLIARGDYISVASQRLIEADLAQGTLATLPIVLPGALRTIALTFRNDWSPTPRQQRFLEIIRNKAAQFNV